MDNISLIVCTENDGDTIFNFVKKVDKALRSAGVHYEIIFVDSGSIDLTQHIIKQLAQVYPIQLLITPSSLNKTQKISLAAKNASFPILATIGLNEYPPKKIIAMLQKILEGYDIVIAKREWKCVKNKYALWKTLYISFLGKRLHKLDVDFTSSLKVFRKDVILTLSLNGTSSFNLDLELPIKAKNAGYRIIQVAIPFEKQFAEKSGQHAVKSVLDITGTAVNLTFANPDIIPFEKNGEGFSFKGKKFVNYSSGNIINSAFFPFAPQQKKMLFLLGIVLLISFISNWRITLTAIVATFTCLYFADLLFNLYLIIRSFTKSTEIQIHNEEILLKDKWPSYTIFCPLYKESEVLPQFIHAIKSLDYPIGQLQVILLLEEDDHETLTKIQAIPLPSYFEIRIPPLSNPKTKPKALNFGLKFAKGEFSVVYDAEDIPDPQQLKKVVLAFEKASTKVTCIQAKLNFYNPFQNILTRVFTAEYSLWFDLVLTGLQSIQSVIPLGGTSNHFRTKDLKKMHGWDAFNVTEDCDLGLRIARKGLQTAIVNSTTLEEANSSTSNWLTQRGRWIKGYIQTYLVHTRRPKKFIDSSSLKQFVIFQLVIGGKILSLFINPFMWIITASYFIFRPFIGPFIESFFPGPVLYMGVLCLIFGNFLYLYYYMIGCAKRQQYGLIKYAFLVPLYWLGMSISGWQAIFMIVMHPYYWAKTKHGLHLKTYEKNIS